MNVQELRLPSSSGMFIFSSVPVFSKTIVSALHSDSKVFSRRYVKVSSEFSLRVPISQELGVVVSLFPVMLKLPFSYKHNPRIC